MRRQFMVTLLHLEPAPWGRHLPLKHNPDVTTWTDRVDTVISSVTNTGSTVVSTVCNRMSLDNVNFQLGFSSVANIQKQCAWRVVNSFKYDDGLRERTGLPLILALGALVFELISSEPLI